MRQNLPIEATFQVGRYDAVKISGPGVIQKAIRKAMPTDVPHRSVLSEFAGLPKRETTADASKKSDDGTSDSPVTGPDNREGKPEGPSPTSEHDKQSDHATSEKPPGSNNHHPYLWFIIAIALTIICKIGVFSIFDKISSTEDEEVAGAINGHEWVDLGLSVKWATCNVGASTPSDYGNYYAWGETFTKSSYSGDNCATFNKSIDDISGNPDYDTARANWGGPWRMPTRSEFKELIEECTWTWTTQDGHTGYKVTGPNGNSLFLPAAGVCSGTSSGYAGVGGVYWSSTPDSDVQNAYYLYFGNEELYIIQYVRCDGQSVRPVSD